MQTLLTRPYGSYQRVDQLDADRSVEEKRNLDGIKRRIFIERVLFLVVLAATILVSAVAIIGLQSQCSPQAKAAHNGDYIRPDLNVALKAASAYSPILDIFPMKLSPVEMNGQLRDNTSIFRKPPSPEVDAAWDYISTEGFELITVSGEAVSRSGKNQTESVQAPLSWGEGSDAYLAQIEVFHQIHCLNELRKEMFYDHYYSEPRNELHVSHKMHCLHMILQVLMCSSDVGIIQHNWVRSEKMEAPVTLPFPDFNTVKMCRNFDGLLEWARERSVEDWQGKWHLLKWTPGTPYRDDDGYA